MLGRTRDMVNWALARTRIVHLVILLKENGSYALEETFAYLLLACRTYPQWARSEIAHVQRPEDLPHNPLNEYSSRILTVSHYLLPNGYRDLVARLYGEGWVFGH